MSPTGWRRLYGGLIVAVFAALAWWRQDLLCQAFEVTWRQVLGGGPGRWRVLAEAALFFGILALTWRAILWRADLARDSVAVALAAAAGLAAEAWGTRTGLWTYYTGERPPLWIVPAWPLGALVVDRLSTWAQQRWEKKLGAQACRSGYWMLAGASAAVLLVFWGPWLGSAGTLGVLAACLAVLALRPVLPKDFFVLGAGLLSVLLADTWGTTNGCWSYYTQAQGKGFTPGIAFGMAFDSILVLACLKVAAALQDPVGKKLGNNGEGT